MRRAPGIRYGQSMKFSPADQGSGYSITSYGPGYVVIGPERLQNSLVLTPDRIIRDWRPTGFDDLERGDFSALTDLEPEILLLGTGRLQRFPAPEVYRDLIGHSVGMEIMDTGAACRTYNILMSERRRVVVALLMIEPD